LSKLTLLVLIPDRLSALIAKGEITERYYNPGDLFDEVHLLMTNDDQPSASELRKTVGKADLFIHNLPLGAGNFAKTLGLRPALLKNWAKPAVDLAREIKPALVRCHGDLLNSFLAYRIRQELDIPYVISLHINADVDHKLNWKQRIALKFVESARLLGLRHADLVLPVYKSIVPYLQKRGIQKYEVAYNVISPSGIVVKKSYKLHEPIRLVSVGRHFKLKNPEPILQAVAQLPNTHLTLVGDGPYQARLEELAKELGLSERINFIHRMPNEELLKQLPHFDLFVLHTQHWELPKTMIEAMLTGMPIIVNRREGDPVPELEDAPVTLIENTARAYAQAITSLVEDNVAREMLGKEARQHAQKLWSPAATEAKYVEIYKRVAHLT
jgi:glycosyltransferase involved in cell wall biosynthesis